VAEPRGEPSITPRTINFPVRSFTTIAVLISNTKILIVKAPRYSMLEAQDDDIREARTEVRRASQAAKENGTKGSKRKRDQINDDQQETFSDAHTGLTDDEDRYLSAVEAQPAVWQILRRRRGRGRGSKRVKIVD
jgi:hypothetical protein